MPIMSIAWSMPQVKPLQVISDFMTADIDNCCQFDLAINIAAGSGFTAFQIALLVKQVLALGLTLQMLHQASLHPTKKPSCFGTTGLVVVNHVNN